MLFFDIVLFFNPSLFIVPFQNKSYMTSLKSSLVKLSYLLNFIGSGSTPKQNMNYYHGTISWVTLGDLNDSYIHKTLRTITTKAMQDTHLYLFPPNSLLVGLNGSVFKLGLLSIEATINQNCCGLVCNPHLLSYKYLFYFILYYRFFCFLNPKSVLFASITSSILKSIKLPFCSLSKQQELISFLDRKYHLIQELFQKIDLLLKKLEEYQKALLYDTLMHQKTPTTIIKLKYLSTLKGRIGWQALTTQEYQQQGAYLVTGVNIQQGVIDWSSCYHVSEERYKMDPNIQLQENDLIITKDGTIGKVAIIQNLPSIATLNSGLMLIRKKSPVFYSEKYLYYLLSSFYFHQWYALTLKPNSTILHLYQKDFLNILKKLQSHYTSLKGYLEEYQASLLYETFQHLS